MPKSILVDQLKVGRTYVVYVVDMLLFRAILVLKSKDGSLHFKPNIELYPEALDKCVFVEDSDDENT